MSNSMPSLLALLGLAAVAGYQNRGKISDMINEGRSAMPGSPSAGNTGGLFGGLGQLFQSGDIGSTLSGGLGQLVNQFKSAGHAQTADSWVAPGDNMPVRGDQLETAIGNETLAELESKTGLSRAELLKRLAVSLPTIVNRLTPEGRLPTATEAGMIAQV